MKLLYKDLVNTAIGSLLNDKGIDDFKLKIKLARSAAEYKTLMNEYNSAKEAITKKTKAVNIGGYLVIQPDMEIKEKEKRIVDKKEREELFILEMNELQDIEIELNIEPIDIEYIAEKTSLTALQLGELINIGILIEKRDST